MDVKYRYGHRPGRRRRTRVFIVVSVSLLILGSVAGVIWYDMHRAQSKLIEGKTQTVGQSLDESVDRLSVDEKTFSMEPPGDWKEVARKTDQYEHSITWQATKKHEDNRFLKLYIDIIPTQKSINNLLPLTVQNTQLISGDISENCATFTQGGSLNTLEAQKTKDTPAKWSKVDFICDLPRPTEREVGTGSIGAINTSTVTGPNAGTHKYFFLYTDHNIQPSNAILLDAVHSFVAK